MSTTIGAVLLLGSSILFIINSCKEFEAEHELIVFTDTISTVEPNFVFASGAIVDFRGDGVLDHGFICSIERNPTLNEDTIQLSEGPRKTTGKFENGWHRGIRANTTYYVRAYAVDNVGVEYGRELSFTTPDPVLPQLSTITISAVTDTSANSGGSEIDDGGADITAKGVCWSMDQNPTVSGEHTNEGHGTESFTSAIDSLICNTTYYVRAYATTSVGTGYGEELTFSTNPCSKSTPTITTSTVDNITETSAFCGGNITDDGGAPVTARGVCWSISPNPTTADYHTTDGSGMGSFTSDLTSLDQETTYYIRAYATNSEGTAYGDEAEFKTLAPANSVTDFDGNIYPIVKIGFQTWMAENLRVTHYSDGTAIPFVEDQSSWGDMGATDKAYCYYNNDPLHGETYGAMYSWAAAMNGAATSDLNPSGVRGVCPSGWHLPSDPEWKQMEMYLGMSQAEADSTKWRSTDVGGKLKETGITHWKSPNTGATNETGFSALPGGSRNSAGTFLNLTIDGYFWSSTDIGNTQVWYRYLHYDHGEIYRGNYLWNGEGFSVRCIRDDVSTTMPAITTKSISSITEFSAQSGGDITSDGGATVTARGVCWSTSEYPSLSDSRASEGNGTGSYTSTLTSLTCNTTYYVRAYATNTVGTAYGNQVDFTTGQCTVEFPTVTTALITNITGTSAESGGEVTADGGADVTARGVCWSTSSDPTISDSHTDDGSGMGSFISNITGLSAGTRYYVKAYATNAAGTAYGNRPSFYTHDLPTVSTLEITGITDVSAQGGGNVTDAGRADITARGVCWSTTVIPSLSDNFTDDGTGAGSFTSSLTGLSPNTTYYVRSYATNIVGTQYGSEVSIKTWIGSVTDIDSNIYWTVAIGDQIWMAENLKVTHFSDGTIIPLVESTSEWDAISTIEKAYCWYDNNPADGNIYGALYTWPAAMQSAGSSDANPSGVQGVCPDGWHLPSDAEWKELEMYLGMSQAEADGENVRGTDEGGKLKETGTTHWNSPNIDATNSSGFTALPGGYRNSNGDFGGIGSYAPFWSSSEFQNWTAWRRLLLNDNSKVIRNYYNMDIGFSVRCVKD